MDLEYILVSEVGGSGVLKSEGSSPPNTQKPASEVTRSTPKGCVPPSCGQIIGHPSPSQSCSPRSRTPSLSCHTHNTNQSVPSTLNGEATQPPPLQLIYKSKANKESSWTPDEDSLIIRLRSEKKPWDEIAKELPKRSGIACRLRYQNYLQNTSLYDHEDIKNKLSRVYYRYVTLDHPVCLNRFKFRYSFISIPYLSL